MEPIELILVLGLIYLAYSSGALSSFGIGPGVTGVTGVTGTSVNASPSSPAGGLQSNVTVAATPIVAAPPAAVVNPPSPTQVTGVNVASMAVSAATSVGVAAVSTPASFAALGLTGAAAGAATAGIAAVVAIGAALLAAHEQRKKQATSENAAMNNGVVGYDSAVKQVNAAYNNRSIDAAQTIQFLQTIISNYWAEVTPVIQPGRNGCNGGAQCSGLTCGGSVGAACCVGCGNLVGTTNPIPFAGQVTGNVYWGILGTITTIQHGGGKVYYPTVFGSSYGGKLRTGYWLTWQQAGA